MAKKLTGKSSEKPFLKWFRKLQRFQEKRCLVIIDRAPLVKDYLEGYIVGVNDHLVLLHVLDSNMYVNGYAAIRIRDIRRFRILDDDKSFANRALKMRGIEPVAQPRISLQDLPTLITTASRRFPLITIYREKISREVCFIGKVVRLETKAVTLKEIDSSARWDGIKRIGFKDITRVDFAGGYEDALALVARIKTR